MRPRFLIVSLVTLAVTTAGLAAFLVGSGEPITATERGSSGVPLVGGAFELVDQRGEPFTDADLDGRYSLIYFGYTHCPDICPLGLQVVAEAMDLLPADKAREVQPIFVTVDPERDTVEVLKDYVELFHPSLIGLTGSPDAVESMTKAYRVYSRKVEAEDASDYLVDHSTFTYLMDKQGRYAEHFGHGITAEELASSIEELLGSS